MKAPKNTSSRYPSPLTAPNVAFGTLSTHSKKHNMNLHLYIRANLPHTHAHARYPPLISICHGPFENPVETPCGHVFCSTCITRWVRQDARCPISKDPISVDTFCRVSPIIVAMLDDLHVTCTYCGDRTRRSLIESHFVSSCSAPQALEARARLSSNPDKTLGKGGR